MKKLITRAITGAIYVALIVISLILESQILFKYLFATFLVLGIWEFLNLTSTRYKTPLSNKMLNVIGGLIMFLSANVYASNMEMGNAVAAFVPYILYLVVFSIYQLYNRSKNILEQWAFSLMSQIFVALPLSLLPIIVNMFGAHILLALFIFIWLNDTGAYCVGSLLGKHRLFQRISPKKSWEGFWGGLALCVISGIAFHNYANPFFNGPDLAGWIGLAIATSVFSTYGDLCESLLKRALGVKDSGNILPGHGGILDRIDSLLMVSPIALIFLIIYPIIVKLF